MTENKKRYCMCLANPPGVSNEDRFQGTRAAVLNEAKWPKNSTITIHFLGGSSTIRQRVRTAAEKWIAPGYASLRFRWVEDPTADIRIAFISGDGSWSYLGTVCRLIDAPDPTMNFGWLTDDSDDDEIERVVLHEFGHALGLIHEHQNPQGGIEWDRDVVIEALSGPPNNWTIDEINTNVLNKIDADDVDATALDPDSIMMYPVPAAWTFGKYEIGLNNGISTADKRKIRQVYSP